jgi:hypothetical protein
LRRLGLGAVENAKQSSNKSVAVKNGSKKEKEQGNV